MKILTRKKLCCFFQMPFLIGCTLGITLSLLFMPLMEEHCLWHNQQKNLDVRLKNPSFMSISMAEDEYQPVLNLNSKPKKIPRAEKIQLSRPRYYSTELGIRDKLFIGVLTTPTTILTIGSALNKTLQKHANKVLFFVEGGESENLNVDLNSVITFADKPDSLAPFNMLQFIAENFINDYDFFFFAKDTTHIRGKKLLEFVSHISVTQNVHLGQTITADSLYCTLDAGILVTHGVLARTVEDLSWCVQHTFSDSSSDNFGRCILHGTSLPCVSFVQGQTFVSHHVSKYDSLEMSIQKSSWPKDLKQAITVFSVSNQDEHYLIHHYFCQQELTDNQRDLQDVQEKIMNMSHMLPINSSKVTWPVGLEPPFKPRGRFDVLQWTYFNTTHNFLPNEMQVLSEMKGLNKLEIQDLIKCAVQWVKHNDKYIYQKLVNGYKRFDPTRGTEYVLDMGFLEDATGKEILKRIVGVRPLNEVEIVPVPFVTEHTRVILLVIVKTSERNDALRFLEDYSKACLEKQESTVLLLVFLYGPQDPGKGEKEDVFGPVKDLVNTYTTKYRSNGAKIAWLSVKTIGRLPPNFAIIDLVSRKLSTDSLILLCRVGMEIHPEYINRVRMNTIVKTQVFFPTPFQQYHPALAYKHITLPDNVEVKKDFGHFDTSSFEHASFYLSDYLTVRKKFESRISMIKADKDLKNEILYSLNFDVFEMFLESKLHVMRAVEPDLRMRFKLNLCDPESNVATYQACLQNRETKLGTKSQLAAAILSHEELETKDNLQLNNRL